MTQPKDLVEYGLDAWTHGDLDALESVLDPAVTLRWIKPGEWDCDGRTDVMRLLRERAAEGRPGAPRRVERIDEHTVVVSTEEPGLYGAAATRVSIAHNKVVAMQQYASRAEALAGRPSRYDEAVDRDWLAGATWVTVRP